MILDNIYVINLDKSKDRLEIVTNNFHQHNLSFKRFNAVNGKEMTKSQINENATFWCKNFACNYGMIGCALSHITLWNQLINDSTTDKYIVLEDDIIIDDNFAKIILQLNEKINEYKIDYINLSCFGIGCKLIESKFTIDDYEFGLSPLPLTTSAYIITKLGANKLLQSNIHPVNYHIDVSIAMRDINRYTIYPNLVKTQFDLDTTLNNRHCSFILKILEYIGLSKLVWALNSPFLVIKMKFVINGYFLILIALFIINLLFINNDILSFIIIIELFLYICNNIN